MLLRVVIVVYEEVILVVSKIFGVFSGKFNSMNIFFV